MKIAYLFLFALLVACSSEEKAPLTVSVIPKPNQIEITNGYLKLGREISIYANSPELQRLAQLFKTQISNQLSVQITQAKDAELLLLLKKTDDSDESYRIETTKNRIEIRAGSAHGIFNGLQTLRQLILFSKTGNEKYLLPLVAINDSPRFGWRGIMLDESRHFFGVEKVKQLLDVMALHKLTVFHWHLTDVPGWRLEIKKYPRLTTVGARGNDTNPGAAAAFYTQDEIREIVKFASERFIEIIPEIDMPGHAAAANRAYPEFSGGGSKSHPEFTFNPGYEGTYQFLTNILREVTTLFPSQYIHLGGDEVNFGNQHWNSDPQVQKLMQKQQLKNLKEVEAYFINRMADSIKILNKTVVGWDEIVDHNLPADNSVVMWWRHNLPEKLKAALTKKYPTVLCPRIPLYFDFVQDSSHKWGRKWKGAFCPLETVYTFPPDTLPGFTQNLKLIKGIQANVWTERIQNNQRLDFMLHPRLSALAEAAWTMNSNKDYNDFKIRLKPMLNFLKKEHIGYYNPFQPETTPEPKGVDKRKQK
ncbi:MAG: beta-N-acetylhexosaminidase [Prolixibacteraceae bacterium]|nr:beta-N-acetylhexosaminidase [Prolixibacteraceae bacterium]